MATKKWDLCVKTGSYTKDGEEKNRYLNVGAVMQGDNGPFLLLNRTFNPAGVPGNEDRDNIIVSCFAVDKDDKKGGSTREPAPKAESDIPF